MSNLKKGSSAILDQILFSGSNFALNIFLARYLSVLDYSSFAVLYSVYLLFLGVLVALLIEPYIYYKNALDNHENYTKLYTKFFNLLGLASVVFFFLGLILGSYLLIYVAYIVVTIVIYFYKRHFYAILKPKHSLKMSMVYCIAMLAGFLLFLFSDEKSLFLSFSILYLSSVVGLLPLVFSDKSFMIIMRTNDKRELVDVFKVQYSYSISSFWSYCFSWVPFNIYFLMIPIFLSEGVNASFKALQNLNLPIIHMNLAVGGLLVPLLLKSTNQAKLITKLQIGFLGFTVIYCIGVLLTKNYIESYFYKNKYTFDYLILSTFILSMIPETLSNVFKSYFKSIERPRYITSINLKVAICSVILALLLVRFGINGIVISIIVTNCFNLILSILTYKKNENRNLGLIR